MARYRRSFRGRNRRYTRGRRRNPARGMRRKRMIKRAPIGIGWRL